MKREKVFCNDHHRLKPTMYPAGNHGERGSSRYICPQCCGVKEFLTGTIYKVLPSYGFISTEKMENVFFHFSQLKGVTPIPGQRVSFELMFNQRGPVAVNIRALYV